MKEVEVEAQGLFLKEQEISHLKTWQIVMLVDNWLKEFRQAEVDPHLHFKLMRNPTWIVFKVMRAQPNQ